jgi:hypothetical protein
LEYRIYYDTFTPYPNPKRNGSNTKKILLLECDYARQMSSTFVELKDEIPLDHAIEIKKS